MITWHEDLFIMAENKTEAEQCIHALENLSQFCLNLNLKKTQIMTDRQDMVNCTEITGI